MAGFLDFLSTKRPQVERSNQLLQQISATNSPSRGPSLQSLIEADMLNQMTAEDPLAEAGLRGAYVPQPTPVEQAAPVAPVSIPKPRPPRVVQPSQEAHVGPWAGYHPNLVYNAVIDAESSGNPEAKSGAGAMGLMQLMWPTAREQAKELGMTGLTRSMLYNPEINKALGTSYLNKQVDRFGSLDLALAAYNAGPGRVGRLLQRAGSGTYNSIRHLLPEETRNYVAKIRNSLEERPSE